MLLTTNTTRFLAVTSLALCASSGLFAQASPVSCGVERWPVKIAIDADAARIDTALVRAHGATKRGAFMTEAEAIAAGAHAAYGRRCG